MNANAQTGFIVTCEEKHGRRFVLGQRGHWTMQREAAEVFPTRREAQAARGKSYKTKDDKIAVQPVEG